MDEFYPNLWCSGHRGPARAATRGSAATTTIKHNNAGINIAFSRAAGLPTREQMSCVAVTPSSYANYGRRL